MIRHHRLTERPGGRHAIILALITLGLAALACNMPGPAVQQAASQAEEAMPSPTARETRTATPTDTPTSTPTPTATRPPTLTPTSTLTFTPTRTWTPLPSLTPLPTGTPTATNTPRPTNTPATPATITPTPLTPGARGNRFGNPGFEGAVRGVIFGEVNVFEKWEPFYCDQPYTPEHCPAERIGSGNPPGLLMGRPEYKPTDITNRVHSGSTAQQWFCFFRSCRAGVFQTVPTVPGEICTVRVWVQSWSTNDPDAYGYDPSGLRTCQYCSNLRTQDDRDNSQWRILVDTSGGTYAFEPGILASRMLGYNDGIYDQYVQLSYTFTATSSSATIFFENLRLWPIAHNDNYIDDAEVLCGTP